MENRDELVKYTIPQLLRWRVTQSADKVALREKDFGRWNIYTWRTYYEFVRKSGLGLAELGLEGPVFEISAVTGEGTRALLQALMQRIEEKRGEECDEHVDDDEPWDPLQ